MKIEELRECPFCGETNAALLEDGNIILCDCSAMICPNAKGTEEEVAAATIAAWNARAGGLEKWQSKETWDAMLEALNACYVALDNAVSKEPDFDEVKKAEALAESVLFPDDGKGIGHIHLEFPAPPTEASK